MDFSARTMLAAIGSLSIAYLGIKIFPIVRFYFLYSSDLSQYKPRPGSGGKAAWALITGASDGIGKGLAQELCRQGFNVVIHGRSEKKLMAVKMELEKTYPGREVKLLVLDAAKMDWNPQADAKVLDSVKGLNLTILINNVGGGGGFDPVFTTVWAKEAWDTDAWINVNLRFMTHITRVLIPALTRYKNQRSVIVNVSSAAEVVAAPYLAIYSATKAYVSRLSESLASELKAEGQAVDVHSLLVGQVITAGNKGAESTEALFSPMPATFAKAVVSKFGCGHVVCTPYWPHGVQVGFMRDLMPSWLGESFILNFAKDMMAKEEKMKREEGKMK